MEQTTANDDDEARFHPFNAVSIDVISNHILSICEYCF